MSAELGTTEDPRVLVPGDPDAVAAEARTLADRAASATRTGEALRRIGTGAWTGPASDAWRKSHDEDAVRWFRGADSLDAAARALAGHADALRRAQAEAARAIDTWRAGEAASADVARQVAAGAVAPPVDPGEEARHGAAGILAAARSGWRGPVTRSRPCCGARRHSHRGTPRSRSTPTSTAGCGTASPERRRVRGRW